MNAGAAEAAGRARTLHDDPADFAEDALRGFVDAHAGTVRAVPGGVVRAAGTPAGTVATIVGGGSGHYPAFCGLVGPGFAHGAVVGNVFTTPSEQDVLGVARAADAGAGVLLLTGNYAGDVMNFTLAARRLATEGIDARYVVVTDDIASAPAGEEAERRGIAGDLVVFKVAAAAAEEGLDLDGVVRAAEHANARTRTLGVAFDGCTLPGATGPLFTVPAGRMGIGVGIHGEPGIGEVGYPTAAELAHLLTARVLEEAPEGAGRRVAAVLNGLGRTKYEELFVVWATVAADLRAAGLEVVAPEVGELVTSLDMAGCSLTLTWLDEDLERWWTAPCAAPAYRRGALAGGSAAEPAVATGRAGPEGANGASGARAQGRAEERPCSPAARSRVGAVVGGLEAVAGAIAQIEEELGRLDAVAGDGDHGRGMVRGTAAALAAAREADGGPGDVLTDAGRAWAGRAGGTSGVLWGAMLEAVGGVLVDEPATWEAWDSAPGDLVLAALDRARAALCEVGGAEPGDKTMLDALDPLREAFAEAHGGGAAVADAWAAASRRAVAAAEETSALRPRRGRARPLAEQSVGTPDPGATSLARMAEALQGGTR